MHIPLVDRHCVCLFAQFLVFILISHLTSYGLSHDTDGVFIANTIDGSFIGLNLINGEELWKIEGPQLVSQSLSSLQLVTNTKSYTIVPSLNGQLFLMERKIHSDAGYLEASLRALPLTVESLFSSNFMLTEDSLLTGGKDHSTFSFNPKNGKVNYNCSREGCSDSDSTSSNSDDSTSASEPSIIAYGINNIVRAISPPRGIEKWNLSVREYNLCLVMAVNSNPMGALQNNLPKCTVTLIDPLDSSTFDEPTFEFGLDTLSVTVRAKPYSETLWTYKLPSRISKAWIYRNDMQTLRPISLFNRDRYTDLLIQKFEQFDPPLAPSQKSKVHAAVGMFFERSMKQLSRRHPFDCPARDPLVYLGDYNNQLYVQVEDGLDSPGVNWINLSHYKATSLSSSSSPTSEPAAVITGYYRASVTQSKLKSRSNGPLISMDNPVYSKSNTDMMKFIPPTDAQSSGVIEISMKVPTSSDETQDSIIDNHVFDHASDLIMLLLKASENIVKHSSNNLDTAVLTRFGICMRFLQIVFVTSVLYFAAQWTMTICADYNYRVKQQLSNNNDIPNVDSVTVKITDTPSPLSKATNANACEKSVDYCLTEPTVEFVSTFESEFKFIRLLGRGGFGQVFEVKNLLDGCHYAIKRIKMNVMDDDTNKFLREVKALASLDHSGIVRYHRAWKEFPPDGWQQSRDKLLGIPPDDETEGNTKSVCPSGCYDTNTDDAYNSDLSHKVTASVTGRFSVSHIEDSLIAFENPPSMKSISKYNLVGLQLSASTNDYNVNELKCIDFKTASYLYIQMQLCSPTSLRDWLLVNNLPGSRPSRPQRYHMFRQIVDAVAYLHTNSLVHRDLKPSNILFDLNNRLKLADFGLVTWMLNDDDDVGIASADASTTDTNENSSNLHKSEGRTRMRAQKFDSSSASDRFDHKMKTSHTNNVGTDLYMSPEQESGERYNHKVDIFSLGLIFIEIMVTFNTNMERICTLANAKRQILPNELEHSNKNEADFVLNLLHTNPNCRPSASAILENDLFKAHTDLDCRN